MTFTASKCGHNLPQNIQFYYLEKKEKINRLRRKALRRGHCTVPPSTLEVCFTRWTQQKKEIDSPCLDTAAPCFELQIQLLEHSMLNFLGKCQESHGVIQTLSGCPHIRL
jgi:hypothetical protein